MRIAVFHSRFEAVGGAEVLAIMQARYFQAQGDHVDLASFSFDVERWREASSGLSSTLVESRGWDDVFWRWDRTALQCHRAKRVGRALQSLRPDVVLAHNPPSNVLLGHSGMRAAKVWYCHEPPRDLYSQEANPMLFRAIQSGEIALPSPGLLAMVAGWDMNRDACAKYRARRSLDQQGAAAMDRVIANSAYSKANAAAIYGRRDIPVVHPMVCFEEPPPRSTGLDRTGLQILVQTRIEAIKNVDTVLRGFAIARPRLGADARMHVVGAGSELAYLRQLVVELGLQTNVCFHGFLGHGELASLKASCDVFSLLPWDEPFGMVFPESAAAGLLMVGSDHGGPQEILDDGRYGWNLPVNAPEPLGEALERIWSLSDAEVDRRRIEADRACRIRYSPAVVGAKMRALLRND